MGVANPNEPSHPDDGLYQQVLSNMGMGGGGGRKGGVYQIMIGDKVIATAKTEPGAIAIMKSFPGSYIYPVGF